MVRRRTQYDLNKAEERAHILEGLLIALDHIDEVIEHYPRVRQCGGGQAPDGALRAFDAQAQAIVDMRLRALTGLEREKIGNEYKELRRESAS